MLTQLPLLSLLIWVPVFGAVFVLFFSNAKFDHWARSMALVVSIVELVLCVLMISHFDTMKVGMQFVEYHHWIPSLKVDYFLGVDGISMPLIVLTAFTTLIVVLASWTMVTKKVAQYLATFLLMQGMVIGVFESVDSLLFYFFWEAMLIPMYLSIGIWGGGQRSYAAIKFFIYTFLGSALLLIAFLYLRIVTDSFNILDFQSFSLDLSTQKILFLAFLAAFAVKVPMWPLHTWLPDAHTEAPTGGSVVLAALMLKIGAYGFLRFSLPIVPDACRYFEWMMVGLSLVAIVYIGLVALAQTDMKKLIAYSSISHMGFVTLGCFLALIVAQTTGDIRDADMALEGALTQMISHAFGSGAMFLGFGILYQQMQTRSIKSFGGIASTMPCFTAFFLIFCLSNVGLPGTSGFVGEFLIILSAFKANMYVAILSASTLFIGASYTLLMFKRVFYGPVANQQVAGLRDISGIDFLNFTLLAAAVFFIGLYPNAMLTYFHSSVGQLLHLSILSKLN